MTFEKRCLVEAEDIIGIQYECGKCRATLALPLDKINPDQAATIAMMPCSYCNTATGITQNTQEMRSFVAFNDALKTIAATMKGRNLKLRLEIKCPE